MSITAEQQRGCFAKGLKYRIPQPINWKKDFGLMIDVVENYLRNWIKSDPDEQERETFSEWINTILHSEAYSETTTFYEHIGF